MDNTTIVVRGAREHNLQGVDLDLPRNSLIVFTGVSGSGKSSLAFDTLYAEGQRRYIESLSSYARQFLGQMQKPDADFLGGLSPSISIQQKTAGRNPRSTVGTITEINDYLRVLYARVGQSHCPECQRPITAQSREQILARILALPEGTKFLLLAPVVRGQKGEYKDLFADMLKRGYVRARVDGKIVRLSDDLQLDRKIKHDIEVVIDRLKVDAKVRTRLAEAVEQALALGEGNVIVAFDSEASVGRQPHEREDHGADAPRSPGGDILLSANHACTHCGKSYEPPTPQLFSFNSPHGMCPTCDGLGSCFTFDPDLLIPDPSLSFHKGAIPLIGTMSAMGLWRKHIYDGVAKTLGIDLKKPWDKLPKQHQDWLLHGSGDKHVTYEWKQRGGSVWKHGGKWEGIVPQLMASFKKTAAGPRRMQLEKYMRVVRCPACHGQRLNPQARAVRVGGKTLVELGATPIGDLAAFVQADGPLETSFSPIQLAIATEVLKELRGRLGFLLNVGLHYLTLDRSAPTLSGGEAQRIRLAGQIGCGLVGVLYILDEPSIGLHPRDNDRLLASLLRLRDLGNTVLVVEHDEDTMRAADYIVDFGPGPGVRGGKVVASGSYDEVLASDSVTAQYLSGRRRIEVPKQRRPGNGQALTIHGARHHNLKDVTVEFPLGKFTVVTGVSGSGKSSLINDILKLGLAQAQNGNGDEEDEDEREAVFIGEHDRITGTEHLDKVIDIDQSAIGRTPRSNPATYIKLFDEIRSLFAQMPDAKIRGYQPGRFSFNKPGGRCEACEGNGSNRLNMDFLADVWVTCPVCEGRRFNRETLQVRYKGKSIYDVLEMDVQEALEHFQNVPKIRAMLQTLHDVGLDYIKLGQAAPTLSGGEAQRVKLAKELCRRATGRTLYILDEPTTGLHFEDIQKLLSVLHGFADAGNTVLVIEHNLDVIKTADWLIDLGPEGGTGGGEVVVVGTPEEVAACEASFTGRALAPHLKPRKVEKPRKGKKAKKPTPRVPEMKAIVVEGAQQHNLKNVTVEMPRDKMTVCCGPSGSGKSSLALDTVYAEGQRRYIESLSAYARQFLGQMQKPRVEHVSGLSPAISIEQKTTSKSPRSTVGTVTEVYDYLRILYARLGQPYCPACQIPVGTQTADQIIDTILAMPEGTKLYLLAPLERKGQEKYETLWEEVRKAGFVRLRVDNKSYNVEDAPEIDHRRKHLVEVVVDRVVVRPNQRTRIADAVELGLDLGKGYLHVARVDDNRPEPAWKVDKYSQHFACEKCGRGFEPLNPHHFSFNSPLGWCKACEGLGVQKGANPALLIRDPGRSLRDGAIAAWPDLAENADFARVAEALAAHVGFDLGTPFEKLDPAHQRVILFGSGEEWIAVEGAFRFQYKGLYPALDEASRVSPAYREKLDPFLSEVACSTCQGSRLRPDAAAARFCFKPGEAGQTIGDLCSRPLGETLARFQELKPTKEQQKIAGELLREVRERVKFLVDVGLDYLTLDRPAPTLSGGESQRIRLASQIGSGLTGVLYVLDEPTIGLHPRDNRRLLAALQHLRNLGNTLVLVEHDREVIESADYLLDFGPGAGNRGGEITARGAPRQVLKAKGSLTGQYLSGKKAIAVPTNRRIPSLHIAAGLPAVRKASKAPPASRRLYGELPNAWPRLTVKGARHHNLRNLDVDFPLGAFVVVGGVSGSGKSSLVNEVLCQTLARRLHRARTVAAAHDDILGVEQIDKVIDVDQAPIGNSPLSNPATYTGVFDLIRQLYAQLPESKVRGYQATRFSFTRAGGRCEACEGNGQKLIEMHFLPDVWVECDTCHGQRYNPETLAVRYKGKNIADVLNMSVGDALALFENLPRIRRILQTLVDVGLDYLSLGQAAPTLSGGEAQRVKLAAELARPSTGRTLYILDEPTTGLHFDDVAKLLEVLHRLVDLGNTVIVVEHNLDVLKSADWVIDLGPEAGPSGGLIVAAGTPEDIVAAAEPSHTAVHLAPILKAGPHVERPRFDPMAREEKRADDLDLDEVGKGEKMPWEVDGQRWHTVERVTTEGQPARWEGAILPWLDERIREVGTFGETDWSQRTVVEIAGAKKGDGWFLHALTGQEWLLRLVFRVGKNRFKGKELASRLGIKSLDETDGLDLPIHGHEDRVWVTDHKKSPWVSVTVLVHALKEVDTPAFRAFLKDAAESFRANVQRMQTKPEDVMPWKVNGERWHLSDKGFPAGRKLRWDRAILPRLLALVKEIEPGVTIDWETRDGVTIRVPGITRAWCGWRTKDAEALKCRFVGKPGQFNLAQLDGLGEVEIEHEKVEFAFRELAGPTLARLKEVLTSHLAGFREVYGKRSAG